MISLRTNVVKITEMCFKAFSFCFLTYLQVVVVQDLAWFSAAGGGGCCLSFGTVQVAGDGAAREISVRGSTGAASHSVPILLPSLAQAVPISTSANKPIYRRKHLPFSSTFFCFGGCRKEEEEPATWSLRQSGKAFRIHIGAVILPSVCGKLLVKHWWDTWSGWSPLWMIQCEQKLM